MAAGNMQSLPHQNDVTVACDRLVQMACSLASQLIRHQLTSGLEFATRLTANNVNQLVTITEEAAQCSRTSQYRVGLDIR